MAPVTYEYKKRTGAWGLIARLTAEVSNTEKTPEGAQRIEDQDVWIRFTTELRAPDKEWITYGLKLAAGQLAAKRHDTSGVLVTVHDLEIPMLTDYQEEAAAMAMIGWLRENAGVHGVDVSVDFDKTLNRYVFDWGSSHGPQVH